MRKLISWEELLKVLKAMGYQEEKPRTTSGSAVSFFLPDGTVKAFHKPHNGAVLRPKFMAKRLGITCERFMELAQ